YPPLTFDEVKGILEAHGFVHIGTKGSHYQYRRVCEDGSYRVTIPKHNKEFSHGMIKLMITESGLSYEEFYCATKATAKKINAKPIIIIDEA
ncbi:MAG: type II toxin-antitoxin system HicA family toxin, partial [bacterium]|nr:type II toxin-antitoxin system HicA family toxin [bacterium]